MYNGVFMSKPTSVN